MRYTWKTAILLMIPVMLSGCGNSAQESENSPVPETTAVLETTAVTETAPVQDSEPETDEEIFLENYAEQNEEKFGYYTDLSEEFEKNGRWRNGAELLTLWGAEGYNPSPYAYINADYGEPYYRNGFVYFLHWHDKDGLMNLIRYDMTSGEWAAFPVSTESGIRAQCMDGRLYLELNRQVSVFNMDSLTFDYQVEIPDSPIEVCLLSSGAFIYEHYHYYSPETGFIEIPEPAEGQYANMLGDWGDNLYYSVEKSGSGQLYCYHLSAQSWEELPISMKYMTAVTVGKYMMLSSSDSGKTILFDMEQGEQVGRAYPDSLYYYGGDSHLMISYDSDGTETKFSDYMRVKVPINGSKVDSKDKQTLGHYEYGIFMRDYPKALTNDYFLTFDTSGVYLNSYDLTEKKLIFNYQYPEDESEGGNSDEIS